MMSSRRDGCSPIQVRTRTAHRTVEPVAFDCVRFIVVRSGSAILCSEFGTREVNVGDVVVVAATTLCGAEPEGSVTTTTLYLDRDYLVDQVFWRYAGHITDRLHAKQFLDSRYAGTAQILRLGEDRAGILMPWLDELAALGADGLLAERFYRAQSLVFAIMDVTVPYLKVTAHRVTGAQREGECLSCPRHCQYLALRGSTATLCTTTLIDAPVPRSSELGRGIAWRSWTGCRLCRRAPADPDPVRECSDGARDVVSRAPRMVLQLCQGIRPYSLSSSLISVSLIRSIS